MASLLEQQAIAADAHHKPQKITLPEGSGYEAFVVNVSGAQLWVTGPGIEKNKRLPYALTFKKNPSFPPNAVTPWPLEVGNKDNKAGIAKITLQNNYHDFGALTGITINGRNFPASAAEIQKNMTVILPQPKENDPDLANCKRDMVSRTAPMGDRVIPDNKEGSPACQKVLALPQDRREAFQAGVCKDVLKQAAKLDLQGSFSAFNKFSFKSCTADQIRQWLPEARKLAAEELKKEGVLPAHAPAPTHQPNALIHREKPNIIVLGNGSIPGQASNGFMVKVPSVPRVEFRFTH